MRSREYMLDQNAAIAKHGQQLSYANTGKKLSRHIASFSATRVGETGPLARLQLRFGQPCSGQSHASAC
jgi:hypothetical protein